MLSYPNYLQMGDIFPFVHVYFCAFSGLIQIFPWIGIMHFLLSLSPSIPSLLLLMGFSLPLCLLLGYCSYIGRLLTFVY